MSSILATCSVFALTFLIIVIYFRHAYQYWRKKGVPTIPPRFPLGNSNILLPQAFTLGVIAKTYYDYLKKKGHGFGGIYLVTEPCLVLVDPNLIKDILTKDFHYFIDRGFYYNEKFDPISANLFAVDGDKWRQLRLKWTPTFTSKKIKMIIQTMLKSANNLFEYLENKTIDDIDIKEVSGLFTTDVIASCGFGIECNSFQNPESEFKKVRERIFQFDFWRSMRAFIVVNAPKLSHFLGLRNNNRDVIDFFLKLAENTIKSRVKNGVRHNDFIQILIDSGDIDNFSVAEIAAQAFLFFLAGFETSSITMSFALFELSKNVEYQNRLRDEICRVLKNHNNQITYECLSEMKFLQQVIDETLRMYPPGPTLFRRAVHDYKIQDTNIVIEKGIPVIAPIYGLHMDPEHFPDPQKFNPDRFTENTNKKLTQLGIYLPFGQGPRNCIGMRVGVMLSKIGICTVIQNFKLSLSPSTKPVKLDQTNFALRTVDKIFLRADKVWAIK